MRFLRTNTAVIVTVGPFYDKTDGGTIETALTITNERVTLTADTDAGSAPTNILNNIAGATSGTANDLNYIAGGSAGLMQLELAAADVNRFGRMFLSITDAANHVPVFHEFTVVNAALYDLFFGAGDLASAFADEVQTRTIAAVTMVNGLSAGARGDIIDDLLDEATSAHMIVGSEGEAIAAAKANTAGLTFTVAGEVDSNIHSSNDVPVGGTGTGPDPWGPA